MGGKKRRSRDTVNESGEVWAKIFGSRSTYYISPVNGREESRIDDEAELELLTTIDAITVAQRKYIGEEMTISLLAAERYGGDESRAAPFFGSVNLRGSQRSALAYLPSTPFWQLPGLMADRDAWICIGWTHLRRGSGQLSSLFIGDEQDRDRLLELSGSRLARGLSPSG
jgi:hypothetical protein